MTCSFPFLPITNGFLTNLIGFKPQPNPIFEPTHYDERVAHALGLNYEELLEELEHKTEGKGMVLAEGEKVTIRNKIDEIEKLSDEDFNGLVITMKGFATPYLRNLRI